MKRNPKIVPKGALDKKQAKVMQKLLDFQWKRYGEIITKLSSINPYLQGVYGSNVAVPESMIYGIMESIMKMDLEINKKDS